MTIYMTARFEVQKDKLQLSEDAIREFIAYIHANESGTLTYTSLQEKSAPTKFLHQFSFVDENARNIHSSSQAVNKFTERLYPNLVAPVEFTEYQFLV